MNRFARAARGLALAANFLFPIVAVGAEAPGEAPLPGAEARREKEAYRAYNEGLKAYERGDTAAAVQGFRRAVELKPDFADAHQNLGLLLASAPGGAEEAYRELRRSTDLAPNDPAGWTHLGLVSRRLGKTEEALAAHRRAAGLSPADSDVQFNLGVSLWNARATAEAAAAFEKSAALKPSNARARYWLAACVGAGGDASRAMTELEGAIRAAPELKVEAKTDPILAPLRGVPRFREVILGEHPAQKPMETPREERMEEEEGGPSTVPPAATAAPPP